MKKFLVLLVSLALVFSIAPSFSAWAMNIPKAPVKSSVVAAKSHSDIIYVGEKGTTFAGKDLTPLKGYLKGLTVTEMKGKLAAWAKAYSKVVSGEVDSLDAKDTYKQYILVLNRPKVKAGDKASLEKEKEFHLSVVKDLSAKVKSLKKGHDFYFAINGFSLSVNAKDVDVLLDAVQPYGKLYRVKKYTIQGWPMSDVAPSKGGFTVDMINSPSLIGAKALHEEGITGSGTIVAILDTGIRPDHEFFYKNGQEPEACTPWEQLSGTTKKFWGGKDFYAYEDWYGNIYFDDNPTVGPCYEDPQGHPHGTHVAGTVAGVEGQPVAGKTPVGIAPGAQLYIAKVFPGEPPFYASDVSIISAVEELIQLKQEGANIVAANMSLGAANGFYDPNDPEQQAIETAINEYGIAFAIAAGNEGHFLDGSYPQITDAVYPLNINTVGSPGTVWSAITVAASYNSGEVMDAFHANVSVNGDNDVAYAWATDTPDPKQVLNSLHDVAIADPTNLTACNASDVVDLTGKIALIKRGACTFEQKIQNAIDKGAVGVIVYNHEQGGDNYVYMAVGNATAIPAVFITNSDGTALYNYINNGTEVKVVFGSEFTKEIPLDPNKMASFSSWGALPNLLVKPDVAAPGYGVYSSTINSQDSYEVWGGTSMATPHVAGSVALFKQAHPNATPAEIKRAFINYADPLVTYYSDGTPKEDIAVRKQGAGRINVYNAVKGYDTYMVTTGFPNAQFNDKPIAHLGAIQQLPISFNVKIHNGSNITKTYQLYLQVFSSAAPGLGIFGATGTISPSSVTVAPGADAIVTVKLTDADVIGWLEGRVIAVDQTGKHMLLPFAGLNDPMGPYYYGDPSFAEQYGTAYLGGANPAADWAWFSPARYLDYFGSRYGENYATYEGWTGWWDMFYLQLGYIRPIGVDYNFNYKHLYAGTPMDVSWFFYFTPDFNYTAMRGIYDFKIDLYTDNANYNADPMATPQPGELVKTVFNNGSGQIRKNWYGYYHCNDEGCYYNMFYDSYLNEGRYVAKVYAKPQAVVDPYNQYGSDVPEQLVGLFPIAIDQTPPEFDGVSPVIYVKDSEGNVTGLKTTIFNPHDDLTGIIGYDVYVYFDEDINQDGYIDEDDNVYLGYSNDSNTIVIDFYELRNKLLQQYGYDIGDNVIDHIKEFKVDIVDGSFWNVKTALDVSLGGNEIITLNPGWNNVGFPIDSSKSIKDILKGLPISAIYTLTSGTWHDASNQSPKMGYGYFVRYDGDEPVTILLPYVYKNASYVEFDNEGTGWYSIAIDGSPVPAADLHAYNAEGATVTIDALYCYDGVFHSVTSDQMLLPGRGYLLRVSQPIKMVKWKNTLTIKTLIVENPYGASVNQEWANIVGDFIGDYTVVDPNETDITYDLLKQYDLVIWLYQHFHSDAREAVEQYLSDGKAFIIGDGYDIGYYADSNWLSQWFHATYVADNSHATKSIGQDGTPFEGLTINVTNKWPDVMEFDDNVDVLAKYQDGDAPGNTSVAGYKGSYKFVYFTFRWVDSQTHQQNDKVFKAVLEYLFSH